MEEIIEKAVVAVPVILQVFGAAAVIARFTPTPKDDAIILPAYKLLQLLAFNKGWAENLKKPGRG